MKPILTDQDFGGASRIVNLPDPTLAQHAATKNYVDQAVEGLAWKDDVRVASTATINLAAPGANIDGVAMAVNDRFLAKDQAVGTENGIYIWNGAAAAATRALDMNASAEFNGAVVTVDLGTANAGTTWRQTAVAPVVGTTAIAWTAFSVAAPAASTATAGVAALATQAEVDAGAVTNKSVTPQTLAAWSGRIRKVASDIGDGAATSFVINHNLNTFDVQVSVFKNTGAKDDIVCDVQRTSLNQVTLAGFTSPPAITALRVVVSG
jgi:hypothetical protein